MTSRSLGRRALLSGTLAATAATAVAGLSGTARAATGGGTPDGVDAPARWRDGRPRPGVAGLLTLFTATPVVALSEGVHHLQDTWDFLATVMFHPGFGAVDAIVVELGNSRYQDVADDYVTGGIVRRSELQKVWRNTTQSPLDTGDVPAMARVFDLARAINVFTARERPLRVLLADPPIDWNAVSTPEDVAPFLTRRDTNWAEVIIGEVLAKGRRCITVGGGLHFLRRLPFLGFAPPGTALPPATPDVPELIERRYPGAVSVVHTHGLVAKDSVADVERRVAGWDRPSIAAAAHTDYGQVPAAAILGDLPPDVAQRLSGLTVADVADHVLFLGARRDLASAGPDWEVFYEPGYWAELNRRKTASGFPGDLEPLRGEPDPAMFPEAR